MILLTLLSADLLGLLLVFTYSCVKAALIAKNSTWIFNGDLLRKCVYEGVRNFSFSENFACALNGWCHGKICR